MLVSEVGAVVLLEVGDNPPDTLRRQNVLGWCAQSRWVSLRCGGLGCHAHLLERLCASPILLLESVPCQASRKELHEHFIRATMPPPERVVS